MMTLWKWDPLALALAAGATLALARRARPAALAAAVAAFLLALASPVATLADGTLFSAHMLQHLLLVLVVPPLLLLAVAPAAASGPRRLPALAAWALGVGAMWLWHAPALCAAAAQSPLVQRVQQGSLLAMGTAFWWPILGPRRIAPLPSVIYLFGACTACTILGVAVSLSPVAVCPIYASAPDPLGVRGAWGLTPERDQQLGGLLMWVPGCVVYLIAILAMLRRFYRTPAAAEVS
jgi:cytochrome c oxidase assembly factor CtaG